MPLSGDASLSYDLGFARNEIEDFNANILSAGLTYYFNNAFGLGGSIAHEDGDGIDVTAAALAADWFFTSNAHFTILYTWAQTDFQGAGSDTSKVLSFDLGLRF